MSHLPVIVGFGGVNCSGRSSFHHGFRRLIIDNLPKIDQEDTYTDLAILMGLVTHDQGRYIDSSGNEIATSEIVSRFGETIRQNTLLRRITSDVFDADQVSYNKKIQFSPCDNGKLSFEVVKKEIPDTIPENWKIQEIPNSPDKVKVTLAEPIDLLVPDQRKLQAQTAGQLPTGFDPAKLYSSRHHPRALQMAVYGTTDAIRSVGIDWTDLLSLVEPDLIGVYASSAMGQHDTPGFGGMLKAGVTGQRASSKQLSMGLVQMPADFINAYVLGNLGYTSAQVGACATLLYNLYAAAQDIRSGKRKIAVVGSSESPLVPEVYEGFKAMSALAEDSKLLKLDGKDSGIPDYQKACRPFSENCGFSLAESAQYFVIFSDDLAVELGAQIHGAIGDVFIHADGFKKSISSPGFGNYVCLAKAAALVRSIAGEKNLQNNTFISAHGTGTPLNRTTESHGLNETAKAFKIDKWPVAAIKCYLGHSLGPASGDQLTTVLGTWAHGLIPGIFTLDRIAEDVHQSNLLFSKEHLEVDKNAQAAALINSKGFGGNNATGVILSPQITMKMLKQKHGEAALAGYQKRNEAVSEKADAYEKDAIKGKTQPVYVFGQNVLSEEDLDLTDQRLKIPGFKKCIDLNLPSEYPDMKLPDVD